MLCLNIDYVLVLAHVFSCKLIAFASTFGTIKENQNAIVVLLASGTCLIEEFV